VGRVLAEPCPQRVLLLVLKSTVDITVAVMSNVSRETMWFVPSNEPFVSKLVQYNLIDGLEKDHYEY
jgi:hypothetical protein